MDAVDILGLMVPVTWLVFLVAEKLWPAREFPPRKGWPWIGVAFLVMVSTISVVLPLLIPAAWLDAHRWLDGTRLGIVGGTLVGFLVLELVTYAWHRSAHTFDVLWRGFHQMHHSPRRVDIPGALVFHPLEVVVQVVLQLFVTVIALGLDPLAAALVGYVFGFYGLFQHWNVRTPRWLGYVIQRPESHGVHHRRGFHAYNYSDLPIWDMLWGTFRNPERFMGEVGFEEAESQRFGAMLLARDVNAATLGSGSRGRTDPATNPA